MKKTLLSIAALFMISASTYAQSYVQAAGNTGFTYDGEEFEPAGLDWDEYYPVCDFSSTSGGGGWDVAGVNEIKFSWGQSVAGRVYDLMIFTTELDLSLPANQNVQFTLRTTVPLTYKFIVEKGLGGSSVSLTEPVNLALTTTDQIFNINLADHIVDGQDLSVVKKFVFIADRCPSNTPINGDIIMSKVKVGSPLVTGLTNSTSVANANLYPNPSTGTTTISGELKSVSDVKITLVDMLGQEVKVISEERTSTINATFDVSTLKKGIYSVVTNIDGAPAKSQMLVVR